MGPTSRNGMVSSPLVATPRAKEKTFDSDSQVMTVMAIVASGRHQR